MKSKLIINKFYFILRMTLKSFIIGFYTLNLSSAQSSENKKINLDFNISAKLVEDSAGNNCNSDEKSFQINNLLPKKFNKIFETDLAVDVEGNGQKVIKNYIFSEGAEGREVTTRFTWEMAKVACPEGSRLPTKAELFALREKMSSVIIYTNEEDQYDFEFFMNKFGPTATMQGKSFWSSDEEGSDKAWSFYFIMGKTKPTKKDLSDIHPSHKLQIICVSTKN